MDSNYLNRVVKNDETDDNRCVIIDYDISCYHDRGIDLAEHFVLRSYDLSGKQSKVSGLPYPSRDEQTFFLSRYLEESCKLLDDFDPQGIDNIDHLLLEADIYAIYFTLWQLFLSCNFYKLFTSEPKMHTVIDYLIDLHGTLKKTFCTEYPHLI